MSATSNNFRLPKSGSVVSDFTPILGSKAEPQPEMVDQDVDGNLESQAESSPAPDTQIKITTTPRKIYPKTSTSTKKPPKSVIISFDLPSIREAKRLMKEASEKHAFYRRKPRSYLFKRKTNSNSTSNTSSIQNFSHIFTPASMKSCSSIGAVGGSVSNPNSTTSAGAAPSGLYPSQTSALIQCNSNFDTQSVSAASSYSFSSYVLPPKKKPTIKKYVADLFVQKKINADDVLFGRSQSELLHSEGRQAQMSSSHNLSLTGSTGIFSRSNSSAIVGGSVSTSAAYPLSMVKTSSMTSSIHFATLPNHLTKNSKNMSKLQVELIMNQPQNTRQKSSSASLIGLNLSRQKVPSNSTLHTQNTSLWQKQKTAKNIYSQNDEIY